MQLRPGTTGNKASCIGAKATGPLVCSQPKTRCGGPVPRTHGTSLAVGLGSRTPDSCAKATSLCMPPSLPPCLPNSGRTCSTLRGLSQPLQDPSFSTVFQRHFPQENPYTLILFDSIWDPDQHTHHQVILFYCLLSTSHYRK